MKYVLLIRWDERSGLKRPPADEAKEMEEHGAFIQALGSRLLAGERLAPEKDAARVSLRGGKPLLTDGPFAETKEVLGGYYVLECASRDEALEWAKKCPSAKHGTIEVRPVWPA